MEKLFTIASISKELSIPESTLRYRAKMFKEFLPVKGEGRKKRFLKACLERFDYINEMFNKGMITDDIRVKLAEKHDDRMGEVTEFKKSSATTTKEVVKKSDSIQLEVKELIVPILRVLENQETIIQELKKQNKLLVASPQKKSFLQRVFG